MEFKGSLEELAALIDAAGVAGHWNDEGVFHEFVADDGALLNWWPTTSVVSIEGNAVARRIAAAVALERSESRGSWRLYTRGFAGQGIGGASRRSAGPPPAHPPESYSRDMN